jgi:hypothetical protein
MKRPICVFVIIVVWLLICGFGGSGMSGKTGIRNGGDFNALDKAPTSEAAPAGSYLLAEDSSNITDESGNKLTTD